MHIYRFLFFYLLLLLTFHFTACSNSEGDEPEPPTITETAPIGRIDNSDGTYYTLHNDFIRLRSTDGSVLKQLDFEMPEAAILDYGYGNKVEADYKFCFLVFSAIE